MESKRELPRFKIPAKITREHILLAIKEIEATGYPEKNESRKYDLIFNDKSYPPKIVLSYASKYATGSVLDVSGFSGEEQFANKFLKERGFEITLKDDPDVDFEYESYSWKIVSDIIAEKRMDKSSFKHHGTGIPVNIRHFFGIDLMKVGDKKEVTLLHGVLNYVAHVEMVNEKNPRTRLLWRQDLQLFIQNKFPVWAKYFDSHIKSNSSTPLLKLVKIQAKDTYRIIFEDIKRSSDNLVLGKVFSREELKEQFKISDATINNGIFKPREFSSIWLFVTEEKTPDRTQYKDYFDGFSLQFEGQTQKRTDHLITDHEIDGNEILVFYRKKKNEFPNYGFKYLGRFFYRTHKPGKTSSDPTRFVLYPLDASTDYENEADGVSDPASTPQTEGKEKTRIQTYYERNRKLRAQAIKIHGTKCAVCGFDFGEKYGPVGEGYIEIHHIVPHASIKKEHGIDPQKDLVPVCSNCHRIIHRPRDTWLSIDGLKKMIQ
jgi:5-methylcytosine-specific restriction protein A